MHAVCSGNGGSDGLHASFLLLSTTGRQHFCRMCVSRAAAVSHCSTRRRSRHFPLLDFHPQDMDSPLSIHDPIFDSFRQHYKGQVQWMRRSGVNPVPVPFLDCAVPVVNDETNGPEGDSAIEASTESEIESADCLSIPDSEEYDVSPEYLEFITVTRHHQQERERVRAERRRQDRLTVYNDISTMARPAALDQGTGDHIGKSQNNPILMRKLQLTQWYGAEAGHRIGVLEDQMNSDFDKFVKLHKPVLFPACPIVMTGFFDYNT